MAAAPITCALRSTRIVTPDGTISGTVGIAGEQIQVIFPHDHAVNVPLSDVGDLVILPGLVDTHVHINDPDAAPRLGWEGFDSATHAAAAGGVTTLVDMPLNSTPVTTSVPALEAKKAAFTRMGGGHVDVGFHGGLVHGNADAIPGLLDAGVLGIKAFLVHSGIDDFPAARESDLRAAMPLLAKAGVPLLAHAEVDEVAPDTFSSSDPRSYARYLASRPAQWEMAAIDLLISLAREFRCPTHVVHLATQDALPALRDARRAGIPLTVETCPHYLHFAAEEIPDGATEFKCAPPIREKATREALWKALQEGTIDMIASDHSPCPPDLKLRDAGDFAKAWGGISSLQLTLPVVWTDARNRGLSLDQLARWLSTFPARLVGLSQKGSIAPGKDADFVIFDPDALHTVRSTTLHHRHKMTPYEGQSLRGAVRQTWLRGRCIHDQDALILPHAGHLLLGRSTSTVV